MRVKARLTSVNADRVVGWAPETDQDLALLASLFPNDPKVGLDEKGYYLSASCIDEADDDANR